MRNRRNALDASYEMIRPLLSLHDGQDLHQSLGRQGATIAHYDDEAQQKLFNYLELLYSDLKANQDKELSTINKVVKVLSTYSKTLKYLPALEAELNQFSSALTFFKDKDAKISLGVLGAMVGIIAVALEVKELKKDPYLCSSQIIPILSADLIGIGFSTAAAFTTGIACGVTLAAGFLFMALADYHRIQMYTCKLKQLEQEKEFIKQRAPQSDLLKCIEQNIEHTKQCITTAKNSLKFNSSLTLIAFTGAILMSIPGINAPILGITCLILLSAMLLKVTMALAKKTAKIFFRSTPQPRVPVARHSQTTERTPSVSTVLPLKPASTASVTPSLRI